MRLLLLLGEIGNELREVIDAVIHDAHQAGGVAAVAAAVLDRSGFEHDDGSAVFAGGERGAGGGVAGADDDYIGIAKIGSAHEFPLQINGKKLTAETLRRCRA